MSSEQLQYKILEYINIKRSVKTIEEIVDYCKKRNIDQDEIEDSIRGLYEKKLIKAKKLQPFHSQNLNKHINY